MHKIHGDYEFLITPYTLSVGRKYRSKDTSFSLYTRDREYQFGVCKSDKDDIVIFCRSTKKSNFYYGICQGIEKVSGKITLKMDPSKQIDDTILIRSKSFRMRKKEKDDEGLGVKKLTLSGDSTQLGSFLSEIKEQVTTLNDAMHQIQENYEFLETPYTLLVSKEYGSIDTSGWSISDQEYQFGVYESDKDDIVIFCRNTKKSNFYYGICQGIEKVSGKITLKMDPSKQIDDTILRWSKSFRMRKKEKDDEGLGVKKLTLNGNPLELLSFITHIVNTVSDISDIQQNVGKEETLKELYNDGVEQIADKAKNYIKYHASQYVAETKDLFVKEGFESSLNKYLEELNSYNEEEKIKSLNGIINLVNEPESPSEEFINTIKLHEDTIKGSIQSVIERALLQKKNLLLRDERLRISHQLIIQASNPRLYFTFLKPNS